MKSQPQQALFVSLAAHSIGNIEEWLRQKLPILDDSNTSNFFNHEQAAGAIRLQVIRALQPGYDGLPIIRAGIGEG